MSDAELLVIRLLLCIMECKFLRVDRRLETFYFLFNVL